MSREHHKIQTGDSMAVMGTLPKGCAQMIVTSPPYWGLRAYEGAEDGIGSENTVERYVGDLCDVLDGARHPLRDDGTLWLNIGDCYSRGFGGGTPGKKQATNIGSFVERKTRSPIGDKQLIGVPWRVAFEMQKRGWWLRGDIIWAKRNGMPSSVNDRPTSSHEYIFLFSKQPTYFYDWVATLTASAPETAIRYNYGFNSPKNKSLLESAENTTAFVGERDAGSGSRLRDVWWLSVGGYKGAHFATYPVSLPLICIAAGSPEKCCAECGMAWRRDITKSRVATRPGIDSKITCELCGGRGAHGHCTTAEDVEAAAVCGGCNGTGYVKDKKRTGVRDPARHVTSAVAGPWQRACKCAGAKWKRPLILDPFGGAATTAIAAEMLGRRSLCVELSAAYAKLGAARLDEYCKG